MLMGIFQASCILCILSASFVLHVRIYRLQMHLLHGNQSFSERCQGLRMLCMYSACHVACGTLHGIVCSMETANRQHIEEILYSLKTRNMWALQASYTVFGERLEYKDDTALYIFDIKQAYINMCDAICCITLHCVMMENHQCANKCFSF